MQQAGIKFIRVVLFIGIISINSSEAQNAKKLYKELDLECEANTLTKKEKRRAGYFCSMGKPPKVGVAIIWLNFLIAGKLKLVRLL